METSIIKRLLKTILLIFITFRLSATIIERNVSGSWTDPTAWTIGGSNCNCIPTSADTVIINGGTVTITTANVEIAGLKIEASASLYNQIFYDITIDGDYGLINLGYFNMNSAMMITSVSSLPILNLGELDITGEVYIYSDVGVENYGLLSLSEDGSMVFDSIQDVGLYNSSSGTINNAGSILIETYTLVYSLYNLGTITNSGTIRTKHSESISINTASGTITNSGLIEVDTTNSDAFQLYGNLNNTGTINISNAGLIGFRNYGTTINDGDINIKNSDIDGINSNSSFQNNGNIVIDSTGNDGIYNTSDFENTGSIEILEKIGRFGIYQNGGIYDNTGQLSISGTASYAIDNANSSAFDNEGTLSIDGSDDNGIVNANSNFNNNTNAEITIINVTLYGIRNTGSGAFDNKGNLKIEDNTITYAIFNENIFVNNKCGSITCYDVIFNSGTFINHSYLFQESPSINNNSGTFNNNGAISDINDSFNGILTSNNGSRLISLPGSHCQSDVIPNLIDGAKIGTIIISESIFTDSDFTTLAGTYDISANSWTPAAEAAYKDTFFIKLDLLGCYVAAEFRMSSVVVPLWFADNDMDGFGDLTDPGTCSLSMPANSVRDNTDCDDSSDSTYPGAPELCDGMDNDCSGSAETSIIKWTGSGDGTYWSDPLNWDGLNVPISCQLVEIPATFNPIIDAGVEAEALQVKVFSTANLSLASTSRLHIDGQNNYTALINDGIFSNSGKVTLLNSLGDGISNNGNIQNIDTITISNGSESAIENSGNGIIDNSGFIEIYGLFPADVIRNFGEIINGPDGDISIHDNPSLKNGVYNSTVSGSPGTITNNGKIRMDGVATGILQNATTTPIVNASQGLIEIQNCMQSGISGGDLTNNGEIYISNAAVYGIEDGGIANSGKISINQTGSSGFLLKGITTNNGEITIQNAHVGIEISNAFYNNSGSIIIDNSLSNAMLIDPTSTLDNQKKIAITNSVSDAIHLQGNLNNSDTLLISSNIVGNGINMDGGAIDNKNTGYVDIKNTDQNAILVASGNFINSGIFVVSEATGDGINTGGGTIIDNAGEFRMLSGILGYGINGTGTQFTNQATGIISGNGKILGPILNDIGTISPGESPGRIVFEGAYSQVNSTYFAEISGINGEGVFGGHDIIESNAAINLGGNLNLQFINGYQPCPGDEWILMRSTGPISGTFGGVTLPTGYCLSLVYNANDVRITMPGPPISNWNGTVSSDWFDPNNWNEGCVPGPESDVYIGSAPLYPFVDGKNGMAKKINLFPGTQLNVNPGYKLTVVGN